MGDLFRNEPDLTYNFALEEDSMNVEPEQVAGAVPVQAGSSQQSGEQGNAALAEQNTDFEMSELRRTDEHIDSDSSEGDNGIFSVLEQMMKSVAEENYNIDVKVKKKETNEEMKEELMEELTEEVMEELKEELMEELKDEPVAEQQVKAEVQEPPVEAKAAQDKGKKRKKRSYSRRRHIYQRRSTVIESITSKAGGKKDDTDSNSETEKKGFVPTIEIKDDVDAENKRFVPIIEIKDDPEEGETSSKKIKLESPDEDDDVFEFK